jgi:hypothetical protein
VQCEQKENKRKAAEHDKGLNEQHHDLGLEQHDRPDEDVNTVKVFKDFHTNTKKGLSDAARAVLVIVNAHRKFCKRMDIIIAFTQEYSRVLYLSIGK